MRRTALAALVLGALALAATGLAQAHSKVYANHLSIQFRGTATGDTFSGRVRSAKPACESGRKVVVFRTQPRSDARIGADFTDSDGRWQLDPPGRFVPPGHYYARMRKKVLLRSGVHDHTCAAVTTPPVSVGR